MSAPLLAVRNLSKNFGGLKALTAVDFEVRPGVIKGFNAIGEVVKEVQVQVVKNGKFHKYGVVRQVELITP